MLKWLDTRRQREAVASKLYNDLVAHARSPVFYMSYGVPDSMLGRFEMICLHAFLLFRRLGKTGDGGKELAQEVHDLMFADLDRTLREQGIGDMGIGKRVKKLARSLYGRIAAYDTALTGGADELAAALRRNLYASAPASDEDIARMSGYINAAVETLDAQPVPDLLSGRAVYPDAATQARCVT